jgi:GNAT superfamily N-acetyltransferase
MNIEAKALSESVLRRLTSDAITTFLGESAAFEAAARPGLQLALSNEPIADLNMLVVGAGADHKHFAAMVNGCLDRQLPFLVLIFPEAGRLIDELAGKLGLAYAVDFPMMVRDDLSLEPAGNPDVNVSRASDETDCDGSADIIASAYSMDKSSVLRALPPSLFESPGADVYVARMDGETCGIWAMGTRSALQRGGIGLRLLSTAMCEARQHGARRFFLGATPAGFRLYEGLGFRTVCSARVWVSGETHQA